MANRLKYLREEKNMTQDQLAESSGVTRYIISEIENEKRKPSPRTISKLAEALGCDYIEILTDKERSKFNKIDLGQDQDLRERSLAQAISLTKKYCENKNFNEELKMKISGNLSYLIEEYESSTDNEKEIFLNKISDQYAKLIASKIFLKSKIVN